MKKRQVYFRADASSTIGYGHFTRSLALADMLKENFECTFFTQSPTEYQKTEVEKVCKLVALPSGDTKFSLFLDYLTGTEIVVLDNYFFTSEYQKQVKDKGCKLVCLGANDRHYFADALLNFAETDPSIFSVEPYTRVLCGLEWSILRAPFRAPKQNIDRKGVIICFGGTDQYCLTERVADIIRDEEIHVISTYAVGIARIEKWREQGWYLHINASAQEIADLFDSCQTAILSSSTICVEALSRGIPVMAGYYVDNQRKMYELLEKNNIIIGVGNFLKHNVEQRVRQSFKTTLKYTCCKTAIDYSLQNKQYNILFQSL